MYRRNARTTRSIPASGLLGFKVEMLASHVDRLFESGEETFPEEHQEPDGMRLAVSFDVAWLVAVKL